MDSRAVLLQQGQREDLEGEALVIDDVPMQNVEFGVGHGVEKGVDDAQGEEVTAGWGSGGECGGCKKLAAKCIAKRCCAMRTSCLS